MIFFRLWFIVSRSLPDRAPDSTSRLIADAVRVSGRRAILCAGWAGLGTVCRGLTNCGVTFPSEILTIREAPHNILFPRVAAVVHHGGAGTTAAAIRAGVPQVVIPHLGDQFFHGRRVTVCQATTNCWDLRIGAKPIPRSHLTAPRLAAAIHTVCRGHSLSNGDKLLTNCEVLRSPAIRSNARTLAESLREVDGVASAQFVAA